jgi:hypothetical protein
MVTKRGSFLGNPFFKMGSPFSDRGIKIRDRGVTIGKWVTHLKKWVAHFLGSRVWGPKGQKMGIPSCKMGSPFSDRGASGTSIPDFDPTIGKWATHLTRWAAQKRPPFCYHSLDPQKIKNFPSTN